MIVWPLTLMQRGLSPLIRVTQAFAGFFTGGLGVPAVTEDEIRADIHLGRKAGELSASELQLLNAVFHFDDMLARQVMVARRDVVFFDVHWSLEKCLEIAKETRTRAFRHRVMDEVIGAGPCGPAWDRRRRWLLRSVAGYPTYSRVPISRPRDEHPPADE